MKLSVRERCMLFSILPPEGGFMMLRIVRQLREALDFSEEERQRFGVKVANGLTSWERSEDREYKFGRRSLSLIHQQFKQLDEQGKLNLDLLPLAEKFLGGESLVEEERAVERGDLTAAEAVETGGPELSRNGVLEPAGVKD